MPKYDARGNKKGKGGRFFALQHQMMNSKAWQSLTPQEVAVFLRVAYRFHGANNGELALSARDAAKEANVSKTTPQTYQSPAAYDRQAHGSRD